MPMSLMILEVFNLINALFADEPIGYFDSLPTTYRVKTILKSFNSRRRFASIFLWRNSKPKKEKAQARRR